MYSSCEVFPVQFVSGFCVSDMMMNKRVKVGVETSETISRTASTSARTENGGKINTLSAPLRKVLAGISIGQLLMVVVTAATLGAFVNANMKEISSLKQTTENLQEKINILEAKQGGVVSPNQWSDNEPKWEEIEAKINFCETSYETHFLEMSNNLTEMKAEQTSYKSTVTALYARLTQMASVINDCTCNSTMLHYHDERIIELEADIVAIDDTTCFNYSKNITELQNQTSIHEASITHLEENYQNISGSIRTFGTTITQIELSRTKDQENINGMNKAIRSSVAGLERNSTYYKNDVQDLFTRISDVESAEARNRALTSTLNNSVTDLQADFSAQIQNMNTRNRSIMHLTETVAINSHSLQNMSEKLSAFDVERKINVAAIEANNERLSQLALNVNATMTLLHNLESNVTYIEGMKSAFTVTFPDQGSEPGTVRFTNTVINIGTHYSTSTGQFICDYPGIYVFTLHILQRRSASYASCEIRKNSKSASTEAHTNPDGGIGYFSSSTSVILHLVRGDYVDVYCRSGVASIEQTYCSFSGFQN